MKVVVLLDIPLASCRRKCIHGKYPSRAIVVGNWVDNRFVFHQVLFLPAMCAILWWLAIMILLHHRWFCAGSVHNCGMCQRQCHLNLFSFPSKKRKTDQGGVVQMTQLVIHANTYLGDVRLSSALHLSVAIISVVTPYLPQKCHALMLPCLFV